MKYYYIECAIYCGLGSGSWIGKEKSVYKGDIVDFLIKSKKNIYRNITLVLELDRKQYIKLKKEFPNEHQCND